MKQNRIGIIGGGASGIIAAITAAMDGAKVTIFEKNSILGKKLLATGNGRCNLTNTNMSLSMYHTDDIEFLRSCLNKFDDDDAILFFKQCGLMMKDKGGYIYPLSEQASSVVDVLKFKLKQYEVDVLLEQGVLEVIKNENDFIIKTSDSEYCFDRVIVACGSEAGLSKKDRSYAGKSGLGLLNKLGIPFKSFEPALVQIKCKENYFDEVAGVRAECMMTLFDEENAISREYGELQLTKVGISGIPTFQLSHDINKGLKSGKVMRVVIDFMPELDEDEYITYLNGRLLAYQDELVVDFFAGMINSKLISLFFKLVNLKHDDKVCEENLDKIFEVCSLIKQWVVTCDESLGFEDAQVCMGGVAFDELTHSFETKKVPGLYVIGELCDIDGKCGGYNLQWAWTSGYIAGKGAANASY